METSKGLWEGMEKKKCLCKKRKEGNAFTKSLQNNTFEFAYAVWRWGDMCKKVASWTSVTEELNLFVHTIMLKGIRWKITPTLKKNRNNEGDWGAIVVGHLTGLTTKTTDRWAAGVGPRILEKWEPNVKEYGVEKC